ncbi:hypothetical protein LCI18_011009 [Fusarium solani-melongenae]|uniref:Uncharacterized protein n=1 Tax=Fusarium solani subsp. cucurbitae TaxID=2747967 RepID=A0ACD3ZFF3_FUSSC|nr:hypothetical protein LCI18_011009 [Fusarium solani-melongenae]
MSSHDDSRGPTAEAPVSDDNHLSQSFSPTKPLALPERVSSLSHPHRSTQIPASSIPKRTSSKRQASWTSKFANKSVDDLMTIRYKIDKDIDASRKKVKRHISMDAEYWEGYLAIEQLRQEKTLVDSRIKLEEFERNNPDQDWHDEDEAATSKANYDGQKHIVSIVSKQIAKLRDRKASGSESWLRHFMTFRVGLDLPLSKGKRSKSHQHNMGKALSAVYGSSKRRRWCPVMRQWGSSKVVKAAHLFPWKQVDSMDEIFGQGASEEIFSPCNGLFLHVDIESALDKGLIAFVPDVDLEPADIDKPFQDQQERNNRLRAWETGPVKQYKLVVMNKTAKAVKEELFDQDKHGFTTLLDLHGRKLEFKTDFRPRARYVWWTFLYAVMRTASVQDTPSTKDTSPYDVQQHEVRKATRYWGTRGRYVKRNLVLGLIQELGQDVNSILDQVIDDDEEGDEQPEPALVASIALNAATARGEDDEEEDDEEEDDEEEDNEEEA